MTDHLSNTSLSSTLLTHLKWPETDKSQAKPSVVGSGISSVTTVCRPLHLRQGFIGMFQLRNSYT